jgi:hypothetical protein
MVYLTATAPPSMHPTVLHVAELDTETLIVYRDTHYTNEHCLLGRAGQRQYAFVSKMEPTARMFLEAPLCRWTAVDAHTNVQGTRSSTTITTSARATMMELQRSYSSSAGPMTLCTSHPRRDCAACMENVPLFRWRKGAGDASYRVE